ncbi:MAG TPA: ankyrin repeat domain-containing protein, partial [Chlamydiales bacterium]|nr:ankyrin repeat domain-containing protein [Chlamydiales bacterium]
PPLCPICLDPFTPGNPEHPLHDNIHPIHLPCLYDTIKHLGAKFIPDKLRCPLCRKRVRKVFEESADKITIQDPGKAILETIRHSKFVLRALEINAPQAAQELIADADFLSQSCRNDALIKASSKGYLEVVQAILAKQSAPISVDIFRSTVQIAYQNGHESIVKALLNHLILEEEDDAPLLKKQKPNPQTPQHQTALELTFSNTTISW